MLRDKAIAAYSGDRGLERRNTDRIRLLELSSDPVRRAKRINAIRRAQNAQETRRLKSVASLNFYNPKWLCKKIWLSFCSRTGIKNLSEFLEVLKTQRNASSMLELYTGLSA